MYNFLMVVYLEYLIIDNFIFDFFLLLLTFKDKVKNRSVKRIIISSLYSTIFAVIFPLLNFHELVLFALKIVLAFSTVALGGKFSSFKDYIFKVNKFILLTFVFGGIIYGVTSLIGVRYTFLYGTTNALIPFGFLMACAVVIYLSCDKFFGRLFVKKIVYPFVVKCSLFQNGQKISVGGFIDSGNNIVFNGCEGVCIADKKLVKELFLRGFLDGVPIGLINVNTVSGKSLVKIYQIDRIEIYFNDKVNIISNAKLGIPEKGVAFSENYHLILSSEYALCG